MFKWFGRTSAPVAPYTPPPITVQTYESMENDKRRPLLTQLASLCRGKYSAAFLRRNEEWTHLLTIEKEKVPAAFLLLQLQPGSTPKVVMLCAKEKQTGYPQALMEKAEELAKKEGETTLELELGDGTPKEIYERMGFREKNFPYMEKSLLGGSRLNVQRRSTQRNRRNRKGRQLRKLTTRRR
jgi:hypothetical protein